MGGGGMRAALRGGVMIEVVVGAREGWGRGMKMVRMVKRGEVVVVVVEDKCGGPVCVTIIVRSPVVLPKLHV